MESVQWEKNIISQYDCVIIATKHDKINFLELSKWSDCIVDTRNAMEGIPVIEGQVIKA